MQFKKNDVRKQLLEQLEIPEETIRFLEGQNVPLLFEWCYLCAAEGMPEEKLKKTSEEAEKDRTLASETFKRERMKYLQASFENNADLGEKFEQLAKKVEDMFQRASSVLAAFDETVKQAFREKEKLYGDIIIEKNGVLQEKDKRIEDLEERISEMKKEKKDQQDRIRSLEDQLRTTEIHLSSKKRIMESDPRESSQDEQEEVLLPQKEKDGSERDWVVPDAPIVVRNNNRLPWFRFLSRKKEKEAERFIRLFVENKDYSDEQKEFLIRCLEKGDPVDFICEYASPSLSVKQMAWFRTVVGRRMNDGR